MPRAVRFELAEADGSSAFGQGMDLSPPHSDSMSGEQDQPGGAHKDRSQSDAERSTDDALDLPRVLAIQMHGGKVGCAFFDVTTGRLSLLEDAPEQGRRVHVHSKSSLDAEEDEEASDSGAAQERSAETSNVAETAKETLMTLLEQFHPVSLVLTSSDSSNRFHDAVRKELIYQECVLSIRPSTEFASASGSQRISSLSLHDPAAALSEGMNDSATTQSASAGTVTSFGSKLASSCAVDLHAMPLSVGAAGALLSHLTRIQASLESSEASFLGGDSSSAASTRLQISSIEGIVLQDCLSISAESRIALDVFGEESHAALHSAARKHEGLSLFGILDTTRTPLSHSLLRRWLLLPTTQIDVLQERQAAVATFALPSNATTVRNIERELKGVKNIPKMIGLLLHGTAKLPDWKAIMKFCYHALVVREALMDLSIFESVEVVMKAKALLDKKVLNFCSEHIAGVIDFDESLSVARICIRSGYDDELDRWKQLYAGLPDLLNKIAQDVRPDVDPAYREISICYFPQLGYLLAIPMTEDMDGQVPELSGWDFQFASENASYFKGQKMRDLDAHLGDIHTLIVEREIEHLYALQEAIAQHATALLHMADLLAELDCLLALADAAARYSWTRPEMTDENVIEIFQGRHALQELTVDNFVPNDAYLMGGVTRPTAEVGEQNDSDGRHDKSLLVITGANGSGKSIYIKQIGLIVLLAHIGSFVPAQGARIGICDQILTSVQARHSVSRLQSSFLLDVAQIGFALRQCTARSLILFDEIGKGTDATDGAALFAATIRHLLEREDGCPKTIVATHFHEAFHPSILPPDLPFQTAHMEIMLSQTMTSEDSTSVLDDELVFLFRLAPGLALTSNAAHLARVFLVPEDVVERAEHVAELARTHNLAALLLEDDAAEAEEETTRQSGSSARSGGTSRRQEERAKVAAAEERVRKFLEWSVEDEEVDDDGENGSMSTGERDAIRSGLAKIMVIPDGVGSTSEP